MSHVHLSPVLAASAVTFALSTTSALAGTIPPTGLTVDVPLNTQNVGILPGENLTPTTSQVYTDDVYLNTLSFGTVSFNKTDNFSAAKNFEVISGFGNVNAEWGDNDNTSDGDGTPIPPGTPQETTDRDAQNAGLLKVFNSLSLTEMTDGESGSHSYKVLFENGVTDNDAGVDDAPEIVLFERGMNDTFDISLILGGSFDDPILSSALTISSNDFTATDVRVNTKEISNPQTIGIGAFDLNDWGISSEDTPVFGFVFSGKGADLSGIIATGESDQFVPPLNPPELPPVPLPAGLALMLAGLGSLVVAKRRGASA